MIEMESASDPLPLIALAIAIATVAVMMVTEKCPPWRPKPDAERKRDDDETKS